ncbi:MAG: NAD(P)H-hydrate dehydratase [Chloroflexi bacterium]|nr:NAD(P)H-hydrate dehydratase [Chloroflexota bacterium]
MKVVTTGAMRDLEVKANGYGLSSAVLMQLAGLAFAEEVAESLGGAVGRRVLVLVGPGNNGGDGLVAAGWLHDWGAEVTLYLANRRLDGDHNLSLCRLRGIECVDAASDPELRRLKALLPSADVVVDALLGIGLGRPITGILKGILDIVGSVRPPTDSRPLFVALDVPTGLNADTGAADPACFAADVTVALGFPKLGMFLFPGAEKVGKLVTRSIGIPSQFASDISTRLLTPGYVKGLLPPRSAYAHKGTFGKVLVVGGSANYVGAPCLAALAALRAGAGLVTLATGGSLQPTLAAKITETTFLPLPEAEAGELGTEAVPIVCQALASYDVLLIGCGIGRHAETAEFARRTLEDCPSGVKIVVDADGLNALSEKERWWEEIGAPLVLTPHPGEMGRLTGHSIGEVNARRADFASQWSATCGKVVVLKGANTLIADPQGGLDISPWANPALAAAGVGDVLSGVIAGLLAQGLSLRDGASAGVYVHGAAGAAIREEMGDAGALAGELAGMVPEALRAIRESTATCAPGFYSYRSCQSGVFNNGKL